MKLRYGGEPRGNRNQRALEMVRAAEQAPEVLWTPADIDVLQEKLEHQCGIITAVYTLAILRAVQPTAVAPQEEKIFLTEYFDIQVKPEFELWKS